VNRWSNAMESGTLSNCSVFSGFVSFQGSGYRRFRSPRRGCNDGCRKWRQAEWRVG
jgi:hypothetical protein